MSNERYLIVSYFAFALVCLGLGILVYYILQRPFETIADTIMGKVRSGLWKRMLMLSMTAAGVLGFLGYSYTNNGCVSYAQVIKSREALVDANMQQLHGAVVWIAWTVLAWGVVVAIFLRTLQKSTSPRSRQ